MLFWVVTAQIAMEIRDSAGRNLVWWGAGGIALIAIVMAIIMGCCMLADKE